MRKIHCSAQTHSRGGGGGARENSRQNGFRSKDLGTRETSKTPSPQYRHRSCLEVGGKGGKKLCQVKMRGKIGLCHKRKTPREPCQGTHQKKPIITHWPTHLGYHGNARQRPFGSKPGGVVGSVGSMVEGDRKNKTGGNPAGKKTSGRGDLGCRYSIRKTNPG